MTKGALISLMPTFGAPLPNIIAFQFNPETLRHSWSQSQATTPGSDPLAIAGMPTETFSFTLAMDVTDQLALPAGHPLLIDAIEGGIYSRLAALEMLMFPLATTNALTGTTSTAAGRQQRAVPAAQLPTVLFVWGEGRILPVRLTSLVITEKLFDASLNPTHADAQIEMRVLTPADFESAPLALKVFATGAYVYSQERRKLRALVNLGAAAGSIELPTFPGA